MPAYTPPTSLLDVMTSDMERVIDGIAALHGFAAVELNGGSHVSVKVKVPGENRIGGDYIVLDDGSVIDQILLKDYNDPRLWESRVKRQLERGTPPLGMLMT